MSRPVVLDASAVMALFNDEPGGAMVADVLSDAMLSSVNWSEVLSKSALRGVNVGPRRADLETAGLRIFPFTAEDAEAAAGLVPATRSAGLSLGDRACLALAKSVGGVALTADRSWARLDLGVEVRVLRR